MIIKEYSEFEKRPCVSFDFDGVLHTDTIPNTIHPIDYNTKKDWTPSKNIHKILRKEHKDGNKIIVVSSRGKFVYDFFDIEKNKYVNEYKFGVDVTEYDIRPFMMKFFKKYNLPVEDIILTNGHSKIHDLISNNVTRHYDDNYDIIYDLDMYGVDIEFILVKDDKIIKKY